MSTSLRSAVARLLSMPAWAASPRNPLRNAGYRTEWTLSRSFPHPPLDVFSAYALAGGVLQQGAPGLEKGLGLRYIATILALW